MKITLINKTKWSTPDLRKMIRAALKSYDLKHDKHVTVTYARQRSATGRALPGNPRLHREGYRMRLAIPSLGNGAPDMRQDVAHVIEHEVAHLYGIGHRDMVGIHRNRQAVPDWLTDDMQLTWIEPPKPLPRTKEQVLQKARLGTQIAVQQRADKARSFMEKHEYEVVKTQRELDRYIADAKAKMASHEKLAAKWRKKVRYYEKRGAYEP